MSASFAVEAITLRATKLAETDLILSLLSSDGTLISAVLKGARNPRSKNVGHSAVYQSNKLLLNKGKNLDIIIEVQSLKSRSSLVSDYDKSLSAALASEISYLSTSSGNAEPQLYLMLNSFFDVLDEVDTEKGASLAFAFALKLLALQGLRPVSDYCDSCDEVHEGLRWSRLHKAALCPECAEHSYKELLYSESSLSWVNYLLKNSFAQIATVDVDRRALKDLVEIVKDLLEDYFSRNIRSYPLFASAILSDA